MAEYITKEISKKEFLLPHRCTITPEKVWWQAAWLQHDVLMMSGEQVETGCPHFQPISLCSLSPWDIAHIQGPQWFLSGNPLTVTPICGLLVFLDLVKVTRLNITSSQEGKRNGPWEEGAAQTVADQNTPAASRSTPLMLISEELSLVDPVPSVELSRGSQCYWDLVLASLWLPGHCDLHWKN